MPEANIADRVSCVNVHADLYRINLSIYCIIAHIDISTLSKIKIYFPPVIYT